MTKLKSKDKVEVEVGEDEGIKCNYRNNFGKIFIFADIDNHYVYNYYFDTCNIEFFTIEDIIFSFEWCSCVLFFCSDS